jgi:hypothetical protein
MRNFKQSKDRGAIGNEYELVPNYNRKPGEPTHILVPVPVNPTVVSQTTVVKLNTHKRRNNSSV